jgi:quinol monooxygenase YgiN
MLIIHVRAVIKPESREAFLAAAREVIAQTRAKPSLNLNSDGLIWALFGA